MKVLQKFVTSKQYGALRLLSKMPDKGQKLGSIDSLLKRICKSTVQLPGSGIPRSVHSSGEPCADSGEQDKISHETAILHSTVRTIIHCDLQLTCFKRCRVQLLSAANRISRLTR